MKNDDLISGWKDIASYTDKSVRTVQRWAATRGLPVFHPAGNRSTPHASKRMLDQWMMSQYETHTSPQETAGVGAVTGAMSAQRAAG